MKRLFAAFALLVCFGACKQEPANPPTVVMEEMFTAMKTGNIEDMKKFITKGDVAMLEAAEKFMTNLDPEGIQKIKTRMTEELKENAMHIEYSLKNEKIDGDRATVEAEILTKDTAAVNGKKLSKQTFELVKEDNAWKIALTKPGNEMFNSMKGNMGSRKGDLKDGLDRLQKMDPDTLKMFIKKGLEALDSMQKKKDNPQ
ncbi:MAG: DUF4878 domain-containing protein [Ferruginibacter sp.]